MCVKQQSQDKNSHSGAIVVVVEAVGGIVMSLEAVEAVADCALGSGDGSGGILGDQ